MFGKGIQAGSVQGICMAYVAFVQLASDALVSIPKQAIAALFATHSESRVRMVEIERLTSSQPGRPADGVSDALDS